MKTRERMFGVVIFLLAFCYAFPLQAQPQATMDAEYITREQQASPAIKNLLHNLREEIRRKRLNFQVGYTTALDRKMSDLTGGKPPVDIVDKLKAQTQKSDQLMQAEIAAREQFLRLNRVLLPEFEVKCSADMKAMDWRNSGKVTGVRDQEGCGSCWAFGAIGAYESSYLRINKEAIDASEQCVLNCSSAGGCGGGWYTGAFDWLIKTGTAKEADYPYTANDKPCNNSVDHPYRAVVWGGVHPETPIPTIAQIKEAVCQYGSLAIGVLVTDSFKAYTGEVYDGGNPPLTVVGDDGKTYYNVNHVVTLIGWNDSKGAWLIKNSWGTTWGHACGYGKEKGYMWIKYGTANVGLLPGWVRAKSKFYHLVDTRFKLLYKEFKPFPEPDPISIRRLPRLN